MNCVAIILVVGRGWVVNDSSQQQKIRIRFEFDAIDFPNTIGYNRLLGYETDGLTLTLTHTCSSARRPTGPLARRPIGPSARLFCSQPFEI